MAEFEYLLEKNALAPRKMNRDELVYFSSGMGASVGHMTNFALCENEDGIAYRGERWPSSEHIFQAFLRVHPEHRHRLAIGGDLASLKSGLPLIFNQRELKKKFKHYSATKTGKPEMVGIVAKMAVNPLIAQKIGLKLVSSSDAEHSIAEMSELFMDVLKAKYAQCPQARAQLCNTGDKHLVEFDRRAVSKTKKGSPPLFTAQLDAENILRGQNLQGELHMKVRELLCR